MTTQSKNDTKVIVALDFPNQQQALDLAWKLDPIACRVKVGKELFTRCGPSIVEKLQNKGFDVFLDLKFHDIPNTVAKAVRSAAELGVWMVNLHASGGRRMMETAANELAQINSNTLLIGVTILTSMKKDDLEEIGIYTSPAEQVTRLALLTEQSGLDGIVCSAQDIASLSSNVSEDFRLVTPGIRTTNSDVGDQKRIMTPSDAIIAGSDYLVIGRPITQAKDPVEALRQINIELLMI